MNVKIITIEELKKLIQDKGDYVLIDVRENEELDHGMIPTAQHIPLDQVDDALDLSDEAFKEKYGFDKPSKDKLTVFYCRTGGRSHIATNSALKRGFKAKNYSGSIWEWAEHDPKVERYGPSPY